MKKSKLYDRIYIIFMYYKDGDIKDYSFIQDIHYDKDRCMSDIKWFCGHVEHNIKNRLGENFNQYTDLSEYDIEYEIKLTIISKKSKFDTIEEAKEYIDSVKDLVYYKNLHYDRILDCVSFEERWYGYNEELIKGRMELDTISLNICEYDFDINKEYKYKNGDIVKYKGAICVVVDAPENIYKSNIPLTKWSNKYYLAGIYENTGIRTFIIDNEYYIEPFNNETNDPYLDKWIEIALGQRPFPTDDEIYKLENDVPFEQLETFK